MDQAMQQPVVDFGRAICGDYESASRREWLVTNGIGGYAAGTIANVLTRTYHGYLVAALQPPVQRTVLLTKLDETAHYGEQEFPLFTNRWGNGTIEPLGYCRLERFYLEGTIPVWSYAIADALLEKRLWMKLGANTTYIQYLLRRGTDPLRLTIKVLVNCRDHHAVTQDATGIEIESQPDAGGISVRYPTHPGNPPSLWLNAPGAHFEAEGIWVWDYYLAVEAYRGLPPLDNNYSLGMFTIEIQPGEAFTITASSEATPQPAERTALEINHTKERELLAKSALQSPGWIRQLTLAADQFIVSRATSVDPAGQTVIAGYPWFTDWGRDTMISLPGLTLVTGRIEIARSILRTFAHYVSDGMLPNRFPDDWEGRQADKPEYNTVDATLWYFEALRAYHAVSHDDETLADLYPVLVDIYQWHCHGTRYHIKVDPTDGLLYAGEPGVQLTWMDAKVEGWVVTPRIGKPVEINALWYNGLNCLADFSLHLGIDDEPYRQAASQVRASFDRFWYPTGSYCYDLLDGPEGNDQSLRPNQLLAVSLAHSPLSHDRQRLVVEACSRHLLTSHGLRSISPQHVDYRGSYGGNLRSRDAAYHQGTVWGWLIGPFISAHLRVYQDPEQAARYLDGLANHLSDHGLGTLSEIFDGDEPFEPRGCFAQAWSVAEVLRVWEEISRLRKMKRSLS